MMEPYFQNFLVQLDILYNKFQLQKYCVGQMSPEQMFPGQMSQTSYICELTLNISNKSLLGYVQVR